MHVGIAITERYKARKYQRTVYLESSKLAVSGCVVNHVLEIHFGIVGFNETGYEISALPQKVSSIPEIWVSVSDLDSKIDGG